MKIEHIAYLVADPVAVADWYVTNLSMRVARSFGAPSFARFLADSDGSMIEIYKNNTLKVPDYGSMDPLVMHLAFETDDVNLMRTKLLTAGAKAQGEIVVSPEGDQLAMLRDPWGFPIQLVKRKVPMTQ